MAITAGSDILASDFVSASAGAGDSGKAPKLNASGVLDSTFFGVPFGGDGSDGALVITSGATNIDLSNVAVVVKNYTSISITGTGSLTFSNPHTNGTIIILKSQGDVTLTSSATPMIDASAMGASAVADGFGTIASKIERGSTGSSASGGAGGAGGIGNGSIHEAVEAAYQGKSIRVATGGGGGSGGDSGGTGGRGGGGLYIECNGAWNFTTSAGISVAGAVGGVGTGTQGGGGGGAGGTFIAVYNTLTADSGTITIAGGDGGDAAGPSAGGTGGDGTAGDSTGGTGGQGNATNGAGGGGGGASDTGGSNGNIGTAGVGAGNGGGGGGGASGLSLTIQNTEF